MLEETSQTSEKGLPEAALKNEDDKYTQEGG